MRQCHVNQIHFNNNDDNNLSLRQYYYASPLQSMKPHIVARFSDIAVIYLPIVRMLCVSYPLFICLFSSFYVFYVQFFTMCIRCVIHDNNRIRFFLHAAPHKAIVCASVLLRIIVGDYRPKVTGRMSRRRCPDGRGVAVYGHPIPSAAKELRYTLGRHRLYPTPICEATWPMRDYWSQSIRNIGWKDLRW